MFFDTSRKKQGDDRGEMDTIECVQIGEGVRKKEKSADGPVAVVFRCQVLLTDSTQTELARLFVLNRGFMRASRSPRRIYSFSSACSWTPEKYA